MMGWAAFQGGTSLRILHGLPRFSEDLDFILKAPDSGFQWKPYLEKLLTGLLEFGLHSEAIDKSRMDQEEFYQLLNYVDDQDLNKKLEVWEKFYNFSRPHGAFGGRAPYEILRERLQ